MKVSIVKCLTFCAGHRLMNHEGKCRNIHGHTFKVRIHATADRLDEVGRVVDFAVIKERIGDWIKYNWDHSLIYNSDDRAVIRALEACPGKAFPLHGNPTCENLAAFLLELCRKKFEDTAVTVTQVDVGEGESSLAEARL